MKVHAILASTINVQFDTSANASPAVTRFLTYRAAIKGLRASVTKQESNSPDGWGSLRPSIRDRVPATSSGVGSMANEAMF